MLPYRNLQLEKYLSYESRVDFIQFIKKKATNLELYRINVWIPVSGITYGQHLPIFVTVVNGKYYLFDYVKIVLVQIQIYKSQRPIRYVKRVRKIFPQKLKKFIQVPENFVPRTTFIEQIGHF